MSAPYQAFKAEVIHKASDSQVVKSKAYYLPERKVDASRKPFGSVVVIGKKTRLSFLNKGEVHI